MSSVFSVNSEPSKGKRKLFGFSSPEPIPSAKNVFQNTTVQLLMPNSRAFTPMNTHSPISNIAQSIFSTPNKVQLLMPESSGFSASLTDSPFSTTSSTSFSPSKNDVTVSTGKRFITPDTPCVANNVKRMKLSDFIDQLKKNHEPMGHNIGEGDFFSVYEYGNQSVMKLPLRPKDAPMVIEEHNFNSYLNDLNLVIPVEPTELKTVSGRVCLIQRKADRMFSLDDMNPINTQIHVSEQGNVNVEIQVGKDVKTQIRDLFQYCYQNKLSIDLKPSNLAWFGDEIKLIDVAPSNMDRNITVTLPSLVYQFSGSNHQLYEYFMPKGYTINM